MIIKHIIPIQSDETKNKTFELRHSYAYEISNFKHFQEFLSERENINISYSALYKILRQARIKSPKKHLKTKLHHRGKRKNGESMIFYTIVLLLVIILQIYYKC